MTEPGRPVVEADLAALATRHDFSKMQTVIDNFHRQITTALAQTLPAIAVPKLGYQRAVIVGMGGSALPADVALAAFRDALSVPVDVVRHYQLPRTVDGNCLVIVSSFSGSTEETLEAIDSLPREARNVVVVTAGGALRLLALDRHYPLVEIPTDREPPGFQPQSAVGYFVTYFGRILAAAGVMSRPEDELARASAFLKSIDIRGDAERVARWLEDRIPIVYTDEPLKMAVARIAKIKFNENSKRPAFFNALPEANHNEMIGFVRQLGRFGVLYLHDKSSHERIGRRYEVMKQLFDRDEDSRRHLAFYRWDIPGETPLHRILAALAFADQCSYYVALLDGFDPTPVDLVQEFKRELSR